MKFIEELLTASTSSEADHMTIYNLEMVWKPYKYNPQVCRGVSYI